MNFQSERLIIREFTEEDYQSFSEVFSNPEIMKYAYMDRITNESDMREYFNTVINESQKNEKRNEYELAVLSKNEDKFIGVAVIIVGYQLNRVKHAEIGYFLLPEHWGKGYATEIAEKLTEVCFDELKMHKVVASCNSNNSSSENIMKKVGMKKEAVLRQERYKNGKWDDELRYGILLEEWEERIK